jgi:peptide/nickel transport system permease protein
MHKKLTIVQQTAVRISSAIVYELRRNPTFLIGTMLVIGFIVLAVIGPYIAPYNPIKFDFNARLSSPSVAHPFGTDDYGRDIFSRVLSGARLSFLLALYSTVFSIVMGTFLGLTAGYYGGWIDEIIMRLMDTLLSIPSLLLGLIIVAGLGTGLMNVMLAVGLVYSPRVARVVRGQVLGVKEEEFVLAAKSQGESSAYIMIREILPNVAGPLIVEGSLRMGFAILLQTSLSYLGMGFSPPTPDWGLMINEARYYIYDAPWAILFPATAIGLTITGFNMFGDGIRIALDPTRVRVPTLKG